MDDSEDGYLLTNKRGQIIYQNESTSKIMKELKLNSEQSNSLIKQFEYSTNSTQTNSLITRTNKRYKMKIIKQPNDQLTNKKEPYYLIHLKENNEHNQLSEQLQHISHLTPREKEVCQLLLKRRTYKQIATELFISINTVKKHIQHIYEKLSVNNRSQLFKKIYNKQTKTLNSV